MRGQIRAPPPPARPPHRHVPQRCGLSSDSVGGGTLSVIGCSSATDSYYDAPAEEGEVVITDTAEGREIQVQAQLPTDDGMGTTEASGTFVIARQ